MKCELCISCSVQEMFDEDCDLLVDDIEDSYYPLGGIWSEFSYYRDTNHFEYFDDDLEDFDFYDLWD